MRFFKTLWTIVLLAICISTSAQGVKSLTISVSPYGFTNTEISKNDNKFTYDFKSIIGGNLGYEVQNNGLTLLTELSYAQGKFDKYELKGTAERFNPALNSDFIQASLTQYIGYTINRNKRLQLPVYLGIGGSYVKGGAMHNTLVDAAAKIRLKFYISNRFGIFAGATGRFGFGSRGASENSTSDDGFSIGHLLCTADAGLTFSL